MDGLYDNNKREKAKAEKNNTIPNYRNLSEPT